MRWRKWEKRGENIKRSIHVNRCGPVIPTIGLGNFLFLCNLSKNILFFKIKNIFFLFGHTATSWEFLWSGIELGPQQWKHWILTTRLSGNSHCVLFQKVIFSWILASCSYLCFIISFTVQFSSVAQSCPTLCDPMNHSSPGLPVHHQLPEFTQTHVHWVCDAIQPSHPGSFPSPPAPNPSQHQSLFQWVNSLHEVAKVLELQL